MPFVKLDCKILDSTLWLDIDASRIFITALLMAAPWDTETAMPQLDVNTMKPNGWQVPAGWYGLVPAAGPGIVRRAGLEIKAGMAALARLGAPEPESRSPSYGGRRLVRIDGGYVVLNYMHYREKDLTGAERTRRWREKNKDNSVTRHGDAVTAGDGVNVTQAEDRSRRKGGYTPLKTPPNFIQKADEVVDSANGALVDAHPAGKKSKGKRRPEPSSCPHQAIIDLYHERLPMCPRVRQWQRNRQRLLTALWREDPDRQDLKWWDGYFAYVAESRFLTGRGKPNGASSKPFVASLEWLIRASNFTKVYEGQYE